ncbi:RluA family pseudouridine synthase [Arenimonas sp.]|nr:RluA family pseudouridine synthase [Candidatus Parcubacteria bacterium]
MIEIIHEEKDFVIINKPAGLITHSDGRKKEEIDSVASQILKLYPETKEVGEQDDKFERYGIVHRLDLETSGVMIIARNQEFYTYIKEQFKSHKVEKEYRAIVYGHFKSPKGCIQESIGRSQSDFRKYVCGRFARGELREAITYFEVLEEFEKKGVKYAYVSVSPKTGRTHQIRVHMKHINHGILADKLYMPNHKDNLGLKRQALHAFKITFVDMENKERVFEALLPADMLDLITQIC